MADIQVEKQYGEAKRAVISGLRAYNAEAARQKIDHVPLSITLREKREIVGGIVGDTHLGWLFVQFFWIDEKYRGNGFGKKLLGAAEDEARKRGVKNVYLDTFSFQAPAFYAKLGYREFGRLDDYPAGHFRAWLTKAL
jgi:ribosomal protein S18 acetylase RimI-like enzyme